ncbi:M13 family metallopeptidase [Lutimonas sp.]|uniref:M13 family metallopeptidase n=1 Tax=Lutimonas sp. TaxID=1872403 RepID=UPI003D9ACDED
MKKLVLFASFLFLFIGCVDKDQQEETTENLFDGIDASIKPGDDFFSHVNKSWYEQAVIAEDQVGVGAYRFLNIPQKKLLQKILAEVSSESHPKGSVEQLVGDFYASGMDTLEINKRGLEPIQYMLEDIDGIKDLSALMAYVTKQLQIGDYSIMYPYISPDQKNSTVNIAHFVQTGLGLPDRDYYFRKDSSAVNIQQAYKEYVSTLFSLANVAEVEKMSAFVYDLEIQLAASHKTRVERRDVQANYNKLSVEDLDKKHRNIGWKQVLNNLAIDTDSIDISQLAYYDKLDQLLISVSLEQWKAYLKANTLGSFSNVMSREFEDATFNYSKIISGQAVNKSREELMVQRVDRQIGFALGQLYVKRHFSEEAKKRALELVNNFQRALEKRITELDWMSDSTKVKAKEKLFAINKKIGYPDVWRTYEVSIERTTFFENVLALRKDKFNYNLAKLNKAPDRNEWFTTPSTVTAYYNPSMNEIVFPAGILQAPYFDLSADDAVNYGGIGMVIGHEYTHAFDDQGAQFDKEGNLKNWWTAEDYEKFKERTQLVIDQYNGFTVLDTVHLNGALTLGENTADNGGIAIAFEAFHMTEQAKDTVRINGFLPNERFFLSIARIWRVKTRDEYLRNYVATDPHSPPKWRVNGPLMNFTPFYTTFDLQPQDLNYKPEEERITIW